MPDFTVKNENTGEKIPVVWEEMGDDWYAASWDGTDITLNKDRKTHVDHSVLLHELGHSIGYNHDSDGNTDYGSVMDYEMADKDIDKALDKVTIEIAETFEGFRVIRWSLDDVLKLIAEYNTGWVDMKHILWSMSKYNSSRSMAQIYYSKDWNNFGLGDSWDPQFEIIGPNRGHFYGSIVEQGTGKWKATNDCSKCSDKKNNGG